MTTSNLTCGFDISTYYELELQELCKILNSSIKTGVLDLKQKIRVKGWDHILVPIIKKTGEYHFGYFLNNLGPSIEPCIYYNSESHYTLDTFTKDEIIFDCKRGNDVIFDTKDECINEHLKRVKDINEKIDYIKSKIVTLEKERNFTFEFTYSGIRQFYQVYFNSDKLKFGSSSYRWSGSPQFRPYESKKSLWSRVKERLLLAERENNKFKL